LKSLLERSLNYLLISEAFMKSKKRGKEGRGKKRKEEQKE